HSFYESLHYPLSSDAVPYTTLFRSLLVLEVGLRHLDGRGGRCVEGRAGLEEADDLGPAVAGALDDGVHSFLRGPAHLHEVGQGDAGDGGVADQGHHRVAVAAKHEGGDVLHRHVELEAEEVAE